MRSRCLLACLALTACLPAFAQRGPVTLNDHFRLGQRFTATRPLATVTVTVPSWSDNEGGLTLSLYDSPERRKLLARRVVTDVVDNEGVEVRPLHALPAGSYYWEISDRTGQTRIGLYGDALTEETPDCAYLDGVPDPRRKWVYSVTIAVLPRQPLATLLAMLKSNSLEQQDDACRQLAVFGTAAAVPALAALLDHEKLAHLARYALENLPDQAVDAAFLAALGKLQGPHLIGVINSIAVRRDAGAVSRLAELLEATDPAVASAAAIALGRIGNPAAGEALSKALDAPASPLSPALCEGGLACADALRVAGQNPAAIALYDRLRGEPAPRAIRLGAARGAVLARGAAGLDLLRTMLRGDDRDLRNVALWVAQHDLPGEATTQALAAELGGLSEDSRVLLVAALAGRGDPAARSAVEAAGAAGPRPVRLAAIGVLPRFGGAAAPALLKLLDDPEAEVVQATQNALAALPGKDLAAPAGELLRSQDVAKRRFAISLIQRLHLTGFGPGLASALRDPAAEVRLDAAKALGVLAGPAELAPLRAALVGTGEAKEAEAAEAALTAAAVRAANPEEVATLLATGLAQVPPARQAALLRVLGAVGGTTALQAVQAVVAGPAGEVRTAALEVLCAWSTDAAAPDLLRLARNAAAPAEALKARRGLLRLAASADLPADRRLALAKDAAALVQRDDERRLLLGALGSVPSLAALDLVLPHLDAAATKEEACAAALAIAEKLVTTADRPKLVASLERVAKATTNADFTKKAAALLEQARRP